MWLPMCGGATESHCAQPWVDPEGLSGSVQSRAHAERLGAQGRLLRRLSLARCPLMPSEFHLATDGGWVASLSQVACQGNE